MASALAIYFSKMGELHFWKSIGKKHYPWITLSLTVLLSYFKTINFDFVNFDDDAYVFTNYYTLLGLNLETLPTIWSTVVVSHWHPLTMLSHRFDVELFGLNPSGHHLHNVFLHLFNTLALYGVLALSTKSRFKSLLVALIFAIHPLNIESVAWVSQRKTLLSTAFWFSSLLCYLKFIENKSENSRFHIFGLGIFLLGLLSKPLVVMMPISMLLLDFWPLKRHLKKSPWELIKEKWAYFAFSLVIGIMTIILQQKGGAMDDLAFDGITHWDKFINACISYWRYAGRFFYPEPLALFYPFPTSWNKVIFICALLGLFISFIACYKHIKTRPSVVMGWLWYVGTMVIMVGFIHVGSHSIADRYMYIPMIGLAILIIFGLPELIANANAVLLALFFLWSGFLGFLHFNYLGHWETAETIFRKTLRVEPNIPVIHNNLGSWLNANGRFTEALFHLNQSIKLRPNYYFAEMNLGNSYNGLGNFAEGKRHTEMAVKLRPKSSEALFNLAIAYRQEKNFDKAIEYLDQALKYQPYYWKAVQAKGDTFLMKGEYKLAAEVLEDALNYQHVDNSNTHFNLSVAYRHLNNTPLARLHYFQALHLNEKLKKLDSPFRE